MDHDHHLEVNSEDAVDQYSDKIRRMIERWSGVRNDRRSARGENENILTRDDGKLSDVTEVIIEPERTIPVMAKCDVLVVGGGPAGISAALAAKRAGTAEVILMDRYGCFGGVITTVGMETIGWYRYEGCTNDVTGIGIEMERLAAQMGGTLKWPYNDSECLDADFFKVVADKLIIESGVRPILHCLAVEVIMEGNKITGVITESKSGRQAILASRVIDCTGDADIAYFAGAKYRQTPTDEVMGATMVFNCSGVNKQEFLRYTDTFPATYADWSKTWDQETSGKEDSLRSPYLEREFEIARSNGVIPKCGESNNICGSWSSLSNAGEATNLNLAHISGLDVTNVFDLTYGEMEGRYQAMNALKALKSVVPGFESAKLRNFGMTLGTRDSRKIIGRYNLSGEDVKNQGRFDDSIGIFPEFIDGYNILILPTSGRYFQVPYGCLVPEKVDNLLVAGRCVAGDKVSHAAMRNMMACTVTGQGAGVAAAVSLVDGVTTQNVDIKNVQSELANQHVRLF